MSIAKIFSISKILLQPPKSFSETLKILSILMTLPVSTTCNEWIKVLLVVRFKKCKYVWIGIQVYFASVEAYF